MTLTENPFLTGNYGPVSEETTATDLPVDGQIPAELQGRYLRTGPNPHRWPEGPYHWFIGDGMVHGVELRDGRGDVVPQPLGAHRRDRASDGWPNRSADRRRRCTTSSNTNVLGHAGRILSLTEGAMPYELSRDARHVARVPTSADRCRAGSPPTRRSTRSPARCTAFSYWFAEPYLIYHVIDASGQLVRSEPITLPRSVMMHDFAITRSQRPVLRPPVVFDLADAAVPVPLGRRYAGAHRRDAA